MRTGGDWRPQTQAVFFSKLFTMRKLLWLDVSGRLILTGPLLCPTLRRAHRTLSQICTADLSFPPDFHFTTCIGRSCVHLDISSCHHLHTSEDASHGGHLQHTQGVVADIASALLTAPQLLRLCCTRQLGAVDCARIDFMTWLISWLLISYPGPPERGGIRINDWSAIARLLLRKSVQQITMSTSA